MLRSEFESLESKYQELLQENLRMSREIMFKDLEINNWKEKYENLENLLSEEKKGANSERLEWKAFRDDLLLVVRAADDYKTDAMKSVAKFEKENAYLNEQISILESKLKSLDHDKSTNENIILVQKDKDLPFATPIINNNTNSLISSTSSDDMEPTSLYNNLEILTTTPVDEIKPLVPPCDSNKENHSCFAHPGGENKSLNVNSNSIKRLNGVSLLNKKIPESSSHNNFDLNQDTLITFVKVAGGSKRNALLRWCQSRTKGYRHVDITNFSTSWSDGMAICALLHSFLPDSIPYDSLGPENSRENFEIAFKSSEDASIITTLSIDEMVSNERPSWQKVMNYIQEIYNKLECCD